MTALTSRMGDENAKWRPSVARIEQKLMQTLMDNNEQYDNKK